MTTTAPEESLSDEATLRLLGERLARQRVESRLTQAQLAAATGVSKRTIERVEAGRGCDLTTLVRVLRVLKLSDGLNTLIPPLPPSPIEQLKLHGKQRQRVCTARKTAGAAREPWRWAGE
jgi:transcriptional regulator with XRE-family HTH domain